MFSVCSFRALTSVAAVCFFLSTSGATAPKSAEELYSVTNIWTVHLKFAADEWKNLEPRGGGAGMPFGRGPGGPGGPRGPGFGGPPAGGPGPGGFGPAMLLAPAFTREGDANKDGKLSREEFVALGKTWFGGWDTNKDSKVNLGELRAGLSKTLMAGGFPGPGGGPGGPGGPMFRLQGQQGQRNGIAAGMDLQYVHADLEFAGANFANVAARYKGNGTFLESMRQKKRPFKVDLNKYVKGQKLAGVTTLNLHNSITDASWMNEVLAFETYREAGVPAPRTAYARVHVAAPPEHKNEYFGLYTLVENVDEHFAEKVLKIKDAAVFKPVTPNLFSDLGDDWKAYNQTYDPKDASKAAKQRVIDTCKFVSTASDAEFAAKLGDYIDVDEFARYMAVTVWLSDLDGILGPGQNYYLILNPATKKFTFVAWDQDHSFGQMRGSQEEREQLSIHRPWTGENRFLERVFKVDAFKTAYLASLDKFSKTIFSADRLSRRVDEIAAVIRPAIKEESDEKLRDFEKVVAGKPAEGGFRPFGSSKPIKGFVPPRTESIVAQLQKKSEGMELGRGGRGRGFGGMGPGGPGGPGFGPGMIFGDRFMAALDPDKDGELTSAEVEKGFEKLFGDWNGDGSGILSDEQLRAGINKDLAPQFPFGGPGGPR